jgi:hypothetical protein
MKRAKRKALILWHFGENCKPKIQLTVITCVIVTV